MLRAGYIRQLAAGIYTMLPLGRRVMRRVESIIREEMDAIGGQEFLLPALHPAEIWKESGRWDAIGAEMFRLRDRREAEMCLGMTCEELFTDLARGEVRSYRELPLIWYQIQPKYRDEPRPKAGVLRGRQFTMKDAYSFDVDAEGLERAFALHAQAYQRILSRCGIEAVQVEASSGTMGGSESVEFMAFSPAGEDWVVTCEGCGYAANLEKAVSIASEVKDPEDSELPERFATPGVKTIAELAAFEGGAPAERQLKTLVYMAAGKPVLFLLRGDHELNDVKAIEATGTTDLRPAAPDEIRSLLGAGAGSLGAVGFRGAPVFCDESLRGRWGLCTGANEDGFHLRHVDLERDVPELRFADLREVVAGEACARCRRPGLEVQKAIEIGHIFKLGTHYSQKMGARVLTAEGEEVPIVMGSYGIGVDRLMAAAIEAHHDRNGIQWPPAIAPFDVVVAVLRPQDEASARIGEELYRDLEAAGVETLLDDRDERPGVKFKDCDLIGIPWRVVLGPRGLARGNAELRERASGATEEIPLDSLVATLRERVAS